MTSCTDYCNLTVTLYKTSVSLTFHLLGRIPEDLILLFIFLLQVVFHIDGGSGHFAVKGSNDAIAEVSYQGKTDLVVSMQTSSTSFFAHDSPCILYFTILLSVSISTVSSTPLLVKSADGLSGPLGQCLSGVYRSIKQLIILGVFLLQCGWAASQSQDYLGIKFASTYLYTWVERDLVRVKFLKNTITRHSVPNQG